MAYFPVLFDVLSLSPGRPMNWEREKLVYSRRRNGLLASIDLLNGKEPWLLNAKRSLKELPV